MVANATQAKMMTRHGIVVFLSSNMMHGVKIFMSEAIFSALFVNVFLSFSFPNPENSMHIPEYFGIFWKFCCRTFPDILDQNISPLERGNFKFRYLPDSLRNFYCPYELIHISGWHGMHIFLLSLHG